MIEEPLWDASQIDFHSSLLVLAQLERRNRDMLHFSELEARRSRELSATVPQNLPELPVEIWFKIFSFVTHIPGVYELYDYQSIAAFTRDIHGICLNERFKSTMNSKLACSLVCKSWNRMIEPFLLEYLRIRSGNQACAIAHILEGSSWDTCASEGAGRWTRRIDFVLEGSYDWTFLDHTAMVKILQHCPNLVCFSNITCSDEVLRRCNLDTIITQLGKHTRLKRLEVKSEKNTLTSIEDSLANTLEILWVDGTSTTGSSSIKCMPKLRAWLGIGHGMYHSNLDLPVLRACAFENCALRETFLLADKIEYLEVNNNRPMEVLTDLSACPRLLVLSTTILNLWSLLDHVTLAANFTSKSIERILINDCESILHKRIFTPESSLYWSKVDRVLAYLTSQSNFPNLRCIGIFAAVSTRKKYLGISPAFEIMTSQNWLKNCHERKIKLEISEGAMEWVGDEWREVLYDASLCETWD